MIISVDWVIVCNLIALIGGLVMGASLVAPRRSSRW